MKRALKLIVFFTIIVSTACAQVAIEKSTEKVVIDGNKYYLHTVESGHTLFSICKAYDVSEEDINNSNENFNSNLQLGQVVKIPILKELSEDGQYIIHIVKPGDTLYSLCLKYDASEEEIIKLNKKVKKNKSIKVGQEIKFPVKETVVDDTPDLQDTSKYIYHTVAKGDTFYGLIRKYDVSKEDVLALNPDLDETSIRIEQVIKFPKKLVVELTDQQNLIDSLAQVGLTIDTLNVDSLNVCDTATWHSYGKEFNIVVLLPFEVSNNMRSLYNQASSNRDQRLYLLTEKIVSFYSGLLIALDKMRSEDVKINLQVYDIGKKNTVIADLIDKNKFNDVDLIIGPAFKSQIEYLNDNLSDKKISVILPFVTDDNILKKYPNNIALKTTNEFVYENLASYASQHPQCKYFIVQGQQSDMVEIANNIYMKFIQDTINTLDVTKIQFNGKSLHSLKSLISKDTENVFFLPFADEAATMKIFTELFPLKDYEITLIGSEKILEYESIDPNYFRKVKFAYYSCQNINYADTLTNDFVSKYHDVFLCEPDGYSFLAYDAVNNFIPKLQRHGKEFSRCLTCEEEFDGLGGKMKYAHKSIYAKKSFSNTTVYIYKLQEDFSFSEVYPTNTVVEEDEDMD